MGHCGIVSGLTDRTERWTSRGLWRNIGGRVVEAEPGRVVVEAELTEEAHGFPTSRGPIVHGGALAALADCALASAAMSVARDGEVATTASLDVDYYQTARPGRYTARAESRHRTSRLAYCHATLMRADGQVVAEAKAVMYFVRGDP